MVRIQIPNFLIPVTTDNYKKLKTDTPGSSILRFDNNYDKSELEIFNTPFDLSAGKLGLIYTTRQETNENRINQGNSGYLVRPKIERDGSLWSSFSEELIKLKLEDVAKEIYEVRCTQAFAIASCGLGNKTYFLRSKEKENLKKII